MKKNIEIIDYTDKPQFKDNGIKLLDKENNSWVYVGRGTLSDTKNQFVIEYKNNKKVKDQILIIPKEYAEFIYNSLGKFLIGE